MLFVWALHALGLLADSASLLPLEALLVFRQTALVRQIGLGLLSSRPIAHHAQGIESSVGL